MGDSFDDHVRSGFDLGGDHWCHREYWLVDGSSVNYPRRAEIPEGAVLIGVHERHHSLDPDKVGQWCGGYVRFTNVPEALLANERYGGQALHELVQADPLTISPSLGCRGCPSHGYIRDGAWEDC